MLEDLQITGFRTKNWNVFIDEAGDIIAENIGEGTCADLGQFSAENTQELIALLSMLIAHNGKP